VALTNAAIWIVIPLSLVDRYQIFGGTADYIFRAEDATAICRRLNGSQLGDELVERAADETSPSLHAVLFCPAQCSNAEPEPVRATTAGGGGVVDLHAI
jgi:hypothetical protein